MARRKEDAPQDVSGHIESTRQTVGRFIQFTTNPLPEVTQRGNDMFWESIPDRLYGNEELLRITRDVRYMGIEGITIDFVAAFTRGGLDALKAEFLAKALEHTEIGKLRGPVALVLERIIAFE